MKFSTAAVVSLVAILSAIAPITNAQNTMVKMCLFYPNPSGHARSDPIINQNCASGHVHTVSSSVYHLILFTSSIFIFSHPQLITPLSLTSSTVHKTFTQIQATRISEIHLLVSVPVLG